MFFINFSKKNTMRHSGKLICSLAVFLLLLTIQSMFLPVLALSGAGAFPEDEAVQTAEESGSETDLLSTEDSPAEILPIQIIPEPEEEQPTIPEVDDLTDDGLGDENDPNGSEPVSDATTVPDEPVSEEKPADLSGRSEFKAGSLCTEEDTYSVTVSFTVEAEIPESAWLDVREILPDDELYEQLCARLTSAHGDSDLAFARFFDISIMDRENKIQPSASVGVEITIPENAGTNDTLSLQVDHFNEENSAVEPVKRTVLSEKETQSIRFAADHFSIYSVYKFVSYGTAEGLDGKSFLIVNYIDGDRSGYALTAAPNANGDRLLYTSVWFKHDRIVASEDADAPALWTFTKVTEDDVDSGLVPENVFLDSRNRNENGSALYFLSTDADGSVSYLNIKKQSLYLSAAPMPFVIRTDPAFPDEVMIQCAFGTADQKYKLNFKKTDKGFKGSDYAANQNDYQLLCEAELLDIEPQDEKHFADKISVSAMEDGSIVVIYRSVWNEFLQKYDLLAVDGYGDLIEVTDEGNAIAWYTLTDSQGHDLTAIEWKFTTGTNSDGSESGYYWLQNTVTGAYLSPRAIYDYDGTKLYDVILPGEGITAGESPSFSYSLQLPGRQTGDFESTIIAWSKDDGTEGLYLKNDGDGIRLVKGGFGDADTFNFAATAEFEELTTVPTLDTNSLGFKINMFNYPSRIWMSDVIGSNAVHSITPGTVSSQYYVPELVDCRLNEDGIPVSIVGEPHALTDLFDPSSPYFVTEANHLFLESAYSETGYFEYNSAKNYAYLNKDSGDFTVYNQLGSPTKVNSHGHFMPYSRILTEVYTDQRNANDEFMNPLPPDEPRKGQAIHKIETAPKLDGGYDYNFGMSLEANFIQPATKKDRNGNEIIFEFSGDDDLWLFVDDVLVLDLGGIHSALRGTVNFTTGKISVYNSIAVNYSSSVRSNYSYSNTIRAAFKKAGVFPDGSAWDDAKADDFFDGDTLKSDYFGHKMRMFYMERGKSSSNLHTRFNIATTPDDLLVAKQLSATDKQLYTDMKFLFQAYLIIDGKEVPLTDASASVAEMTDGGGWRDTYEPASFETVTIGGKTYENVFRLGHGEGVVFKDLRLKEYPYYVREIAVDPLLVREVRGNGVLLTGQENEGDDSLGDFPVDPALVQQRKQLIFDNAISPQELHITKVLDLSLGQTPDESITFQFKVALGPSAEQLSAYSVAPYYIMKGGVYYYRVDARLVPLSLGEDGKYYYSSGNTMNVIPAKDPTDPVFDWSSQTGYIDYVPAGYTVVIKKVMPDMVFQVQETGIPQGYELESLADSGSTFTTLTEEGSDILQGRILQGLTADVIVVNRYSEGLIRFVKVDSRNKDKHLAGAVFELYGADPEYKNGKWNFYSKDLITTLTSGDDGFLRTDTAYYGAEEGSTDLKLSGGTYYLRETEAPDQYDPIEEILAFRISESGVLSILGRVEWNETDQIIAYAAQDGFELTDNSVLNGIELQTGLIANTTDEPDPEPDPDPDPEPDPEPEPDPDPTPDPPPDTPKTDDCNPIALWIMLHAVSVIGLGIILPLKYRKRDPLE